MIQGYNCDFECTYSNNISSDENDELYRADLLTIFNVDEWDEEKIMPTIDRIVKAFGQEEWFRELVRESPFFCEEDHSYSLCGLYNFHQMRKTHDTIRMNINVSSPV